MDKKTLSIVAYITLIGWIISFVMYSNKEDKSSLERFHLRQSLGIMILGISISVLSMLLVFIVPILGMLINLLGLGVLVFWILGLISAIQEEEKPIPLVGDFIAKNLTFIN